MKKRGILLLFAVLCMMKPMVVHGENLQGVAELSKEDMIRDITEIAGYDKEAEERSFCFVEGEFEPDGGKAYFVSAYYVIYSQWNASRYWCFGDVWAVKNGVYTEILEDVELNDAGGGIIRLDMEGRSFALIHTKDGDGDINMDGYYADDEIFLYSFRGEEPTCFMNRMFDYRYNQVKNIFTGYFVLPFAEYNVYNQGDLNWDSPYRETAYFFYCEDGELKEIVPEQCTEEEYQNASLEDSGWDSDNLGYDGEYSEKVYYRIPKVGCYWNYLTWGEDENSEDDWDAVRCSHALHGYKDTKVYQDPDCIVGPYGYRYASWLKRKEEEKEFAARLEEMIGMNVLPQLQAAEEEAEATSAAKSGREEFAGVIPVYPGDSLWKIAQRYGGGNDILTQLYEKNRDIIGENPALIYPGMLLRMK